MKYRLNYDDNSERLTVSFDKDNKKDVIIRENGCNMVEVNINDIDWLIEHLEKIKNNYYEK